MKLHVTVGVYPNGGFKTNAVDPEHLESHIEYNLAARPGRGFFVDGECLNNGYLDPEQIIEWKQKIAALDLKPTTCSAPYQ
jgi:hypothetical protein